MLSALDDWRFARRIPGRAAAARELLKRGLTAEGFPLAGKAVESEEVLSGEPLSPDSSYLAGLLLIRSRESGQERRCVSDLRTAENGKFDGRTFDGVAGTGVVTLRIGEICGRRAAAAAILARAESTLDQQLTLR